MRSRPVRMRVHEGSYESDPAVRDLWGRTLSQIETTFGKLVFLASLRDGNSGKYSHFGLAQRHGEDEAHKALLESHEETFADWLNFSLQEQRADLERYLDNSGEDRGTVIDAWISLAPYRSLAPGGAGEAERFLYASDLEIILELMQSELAS